MGNYNPNGGRSSSDDHRQTWQPQQPSANQGDRGSADDHETGPWRERNQDDRSTEQYGQGQSGYSAGRYGEDPSQQRQNRNDMSRGPGNREDRNFGGDDRFSGRSASGGGRGFESERGGQWHAYDQHRGQQERNDLRGQGDPRTGEQPWGNQMGRDQHMGYQSGRSGNDQHGGARGSEGFGGPLGGYGNANGNYGGSQSGYSSQRGQGNAQGGEWRGYGSQDEAQRTGNAQRNERGNGPHRGKGPAGYQRSDERIREQVSEALADDEHIDASQIQVAVKDGEVTLSGVVDDRRMRREAEDCVANVSGVRDVQVQLRVKGDKQSASTSQSSQSSQSATPALGSSHSATDDKKPRA